MIEPYAIRANRASTWHGRLAREALGPDASPHEVALASLRLKRYRMNLDAGRPLRKPGRPSTSNHPRAAYWREWKRRRRSGTCPADQVAS